jgi:three-Cys-motif partner protein
MSQGGMQLGIDKLNDQSLNVILKLPPGCDRQGNEIGRWVQDEMYLYLLQYLYATRKSQAKFNQRVLIDPFCGSGHISGMYKSIANDNGLIAAHLQSVISGAPFTQILVGDSEHEKVRAYEIRLAAIGANVQGFVGSAAETIEAMINTISFGTFTLAYIHPDSLQYLSFHIIERLSKLQNIDFAIHFNLMDLTGNIDMNPDSQMDQFDQVLPGWRSRIPIDELSKANFPGWFFSEWCDAMRKLGFKTYPHLPQITDSKGRTIHRMIFLSRCVLPTDCARIANLKHSSLA